MTDPTPDAAKLLPCRERIQDRGLAQIKSEYPQAHIAKGKYDDLVTVPGFKLCSGWFTTAPNSKRRLVRANICTVLFKRPCGFPAARPEHFFTDIPLRLKDGEWPQNVSKFDEITDFPQWRGGMWFSWHLQMWDPNRDSLYTYLRVIHMRLKPAR